MPRDARFWRNVTIIALGHILIGILFVGWSRESRKLERLNFVWIGDSGTQSKAEVRGKTESSPPEKSEPISDVSKKEEAPSVSEKASSEIQLPIVTPSPTPVKTPAAPKTTATPSPKPSPKRTPSPTPKTKTKKSATTKATPTPSPKKKPIEEPKKADDEDVRPEKPKESSSSPGAKEGGDSSGTSGAGGSSRASEFSWYARMLHDRFYSEWVQPTTSVPAGAKMSALVRIRIERDGRISKFTIVRPSGNVVVDESVQAVSKRVTTVEPLPAGLGAGKYYDVNINFELNPTE